MSNQKLWRQENSRPQSAQQLHKTQLSVTTQHRFGGIASLATSKKNSVASTLVLTETEPIKPNQTVILPRTTKAQKTSYNKYII